MDRADYKALRINQLHEGSFSLWVYCCYDPLSCPDSHAAFNGVVLPPEHPFWRRWTPPHRAKCACGVAGARSERGARRVGGDPEKQLPTWWDQVDPDDGEGAF